MHHDDSDVGGTNVLLKLKVLIHGQERVEVCRHHQTEQLAIAFASPSHVDDVTHVVANGFPLRGTWNTLIEQEQHALRSSRGRVRAPQPLALG